MACECRDLLLQAEAFRPKHENQCDHGGYIMSFQLRKEFDPLELWYDLYVYKAGAAGEQHVCIREGSAPPDYLSYRGLGNVLLGASTDPVCEAVLIILARRGKFNWSPAHEKTGD